MPIYFDTGNTNIKKIIKKYEVDYVITDKSFDFDFKYFDDNIYIYENFQKSLNDVNELENVEIILFSSGTTNIPKAIMLTYSNIIFNIESISEYLKSNNKDTLLIIKNLNHVSSIIGELLVGIYNGCKIIFSSKLKTPQKILELLQNNDVTIFFAVPTILKYIMRYNYFNRFNLRKLKIVHFYGGPMKDNDILRVMNLFPHINFIYSYGQTEAAPRITYIVKSDLLIKPSSSGKPLNGIEILIFDENRKKLNNFSIGEIAIKGPNIMKGYYKNKALTYKIIVNDTLFTGDLGYLDNEGFLYVIGKKDNMIISQGKNIYPEEIEQVILEFNNILEVLVTYEKTEIETYTLIAYIVIQKDINLNSLFEHCKNNLEYCKVPTDIKIVKSLEKTSSEKIKRNQIFLK